MLALDGFANYVSVILVPFIIFLLIIKIIERATLGRCHSMVCLLGKTAIITGGCSGMGLEIALALASRGARIILADIQDGTNAKQKIIEETHNENIITKYVDLSSFKSIRKFAEEINKSEKRIDILINNAGIGASDKIRTEDGLHPIMQVNHFGSFLLTHLLIDLLRKSAPSRIIFVSSNLAFCSNLNLSKLNGTNDDFIMSFKNNIMQYAHSKLCSIITANGFADKLKGTGVTSNSLHPGITRTSIFSKFFNRINIGHSLWLPTSIIVNLFGKTPEEGAQTAIHLAVSNDVQNVTGKHFWDCRVFPTPLQTWNEAFNNAIWQKSEETVGLNPEEKLKFNV